MRFYFDLYDAPGHIVGKVEGALQAGASSRVGDRIDLAGGNAAALARGLPALLAVEDLLQGSPALGTRPRVKLQSVVVSGKDAAIRLINLLEMELEFSFLPFEDGY